MTSMPVSSGTCLLDMFYKVPEVLNHCICAWRTRGDGIRVLRLVCKDMVKPASSAIRWSSFQVGEGAWPSPQQLTHLLRYTLLTSVDVTILIWTGILRDIKNPIGPGALQQLATAEHQISHLLCSMKSAINGLTRLHLTVRLVSGTNRHNGHPSEVHSAYDDSSSTHKYQAGRSIMHIEGKKDLNASQVCCPAQMEGIPRKVYKMLAHALPDLQHLSLLGFCTDGALRVFGSLCPQLTSLRVEASSVPMKVLHHLHQHLPKLTHFRLLKRGSRGNDLQMFTLASFSLLRHCTSLVCLEFDYGSMVQIMFPKEAWHQLPLSIRELRSTSPLQGLRNAVSLLATLHVLDVLVSPYTVMFELLRHAPCLRALVLQQKEFMRINIRELYQHDGSQAEDLPSLQQQLSTMHICCPSVLLRAGSDAVTSVMAWLQPIECAMLTVQVCSFQDSPLHFLQQLPSVFPVLTTLELMDVRSDLAPHESAALLSEDFLRPVAQCKALEKLSLRMHVSLTSSGLSDLCLSLPFLENVTLYSCTGLDCNEVLQNLRPERPRFKINHLCDPK